MIKKGLIFLIILLKINFGIKAQDIEFTASAKSSVEIGEQFRLVYRVNAKGSNFKPPILKHFNTLMGPSQSSGSNMQIINGVVNQSYTTSFEYILSATKEGEYTIQSASIMVDNKEYKSNIVKIKVVKGGQNSNNQRNNNINNTVSQISNNDIFIKAIANKTNLYKGEQAIITYKLYTSLPIANHAISKFPNTTGFWVESLIKNNNKLTQYRETANGKEYVVAELKKDAVFPQKSGTLTIEPLEMDIVAQVRQAKRKSNFNDSFFDSFFNDDFFNSSYQNIEKKIKSNILVFNIKELPAFNKPNGLSNEFRGAIGNFTIKTLVSKNELKAGESLIYSITVSGKGNLKLLDAPKIIFPTDFETYDPKIIDNIQVNENGMSGSRTFEYLLIPRLQGNYTIKEQAFVFFNINSNEYKTEMSPKFAINVLKNENYEATLAQTNKKDIGYIDSDIRFIKSNKQSFQIINAYFFNSTLFWALYTLPIVLLILFIIIWKKEIKRRSNIVLVKNQRATKVARKRLKSAQIFLKQNNDEAFWQEVSNALWGYISDKFNVEKAKLSLSSVNEALASKNVKITLINEFIEVISKCEFARFAPGNKSQLMETIYNQAIEIITNTESELKNL